MSVEHDFTRIEIWFLVGAALMTIAVGAVLWPMLKRALADHASDDAEAARRDGRAP